MFSVLSCILFEHDPRFTVLAVLILAVGSVVTMRLFARVRRTEKSLKNLWLALAGLIGGGTIWSVHFVSMLAYETPAIVGYDPLLTVLSLVIAIGATLAAFVTAAYTQKSLLIETGGLILGIGIASMHYTGMAAMVTSGSVEWNNLYVAASITLGILFSVIAVSRIARPVTRYCKYGASVGFSIAVATMHFTAMTALTIVPGDAAVAQADLLTGSLLGVGVVSTMGLLLLTSFITYTIDLKSAEESSAHYRQLAMHDPLTGVLNRLGCETRLGQMIERGEDDTASLAVVSVDIDRFKEINDVHGHGAGDHLLRILSERLEEKFGEEAVIGRLGGDEFLIIKRGVYSRRAAISFGNKVLELINQPIEWKNVVLKVASSGGIALFPEDGNSPANLMACADLAMHRAKRGGKNNVVLYDAEMDEANREKSALAMDLSKAMESGELELYFQLQNNTRTREISGVEALLRWHHPTRGMVSPVVFIPIAEETGLISELGDWILREACSQAMSWKVPLKVAVNVASSQLSDSGFAARVSEILEETGLPASRLELEITESGIIADISHALNIIRQLKKLGVKIAMDDYGTGYSSLATLQNFPFDKIKIDREFVKEVHQRKQSAAIVRATIILGDSLDIPVLAEGVETEEHLSFLMQEGCREVQGYLFGKPMPGRDLARLLEEPAENAWSGELAVAS